jgi:hypothetical protein
MKSLSAVVVLLALLGCAPKLAQSNALGGTISQVGSVGNDRAFAMAETHCAKFGKAAIITQHSSQFDRATSFECRAK